MTLQEAATIDHARSGSRSLAALDAACKKLAADQPLGLLLLGSFLTAAVYCGWMFDRGFFLGTSAFWNNPRVFVGNSWGDISAALSGYLLFQHGTWTLPLFHIAKLDTPLGLNIIFTDSIPWVALLGRLVFRAAGLPINLCAAWQAASAWHQSVRILPQNFCLADPPDRNSEVAVQLQLLAAFADLPINPAYVARLSADCAMEQQTDETPQPGAQTFGFLDEFPGFERMRKPAASSAGCQADHRIVVCSDIPEEAPSADNIGTD